MTELSIITPSQAAQQKVERPGIRTSEFWISILVMIVCIIIVPILGSFGIEVSTTELISGISGPIAYVTGVSVNKAFIASLLKKQTETSAQLEAKKLTIVTNTK